MKNPTLFKSLFVAVLFAGGSLLPAQFAVQPESQLWIDGTSSLHDWTCEVNTVKGNLIATTDATPSVQDVRLTIPIDGIACKNDTMNDKMRDALQASTHPAITYTFAQGETVEDATGGTFTVSSTGTLNIAGNEQTIRARVKGQQEADGDLRFTGEVPLQMSAFDITPPKALMGTLKTGNDVTIRFDVRVAR